MTAAELSACFEEVLGASRFADYCPNGLQVEGERPIRRLVSGVTASLALIRAALADGADALLVHHGWFWRGDDPRVIGARRARLAEVLGHGLHLFAYHLPLDAHPDLGNNAGLARAMGWQTTGRFGDQDIGCVGEPSGGALLSARAHCDQIAARLGREAMLVGDATRKPVRVAWCTGGAQGLFEQAIAAGAEMFVSGEISEQTVHLARESGVPFIAAGHHATERFGVRSLGEHLTRNAGIACEFIDIDNPV